LGRLGWRWPLFLCRGYRGARLPACGRILSGCGGAVRKSSQPGGAGSMGPETCWGWGDVKAGRWGYVKGEKWAKGGQATVPDNKTETAGKGTLFIEREGECHGNGSTATHFGLGR
jgi:hypothetical protein